MQRAGEADASEMPGSRQMKILSRWSVFVSSSSRCVSVEATSSTAGVFREFVHRPAGPRIQAGCCVMYPHSWSSTLSDTFCHHFKLCYADKRSNQQGGGYIFFSFIALTFFFKGTLWCSWPLVVLGIFREVGAFVLFIFFTNCMHTWTHMHILTVVTHYPTDWQLVVTIHETLSKW